jgi:hypothetical protein
MGRESKQNASLNALIDKSKLNEGRSDEFLQPKKWNFYKAKLCLFHSTKLFSLNKDSY